MTEQHLSDEAVAAFADGVLGGHARDRAARHVDSCAECRQAVRVQREAVLTLRAAAAPHLPDALRDRLRTLPQTTPINAPPTVLSPEGTPMFATFAQAAAFAPSPARSRRDRPAEAGQVGQVAPAAPHRMRPIATAAAVVALAGAFTASSAARPEEPAPGSSQLVRHVFEDGGAERSRSGGHEPTWVRYPGQP